MEEVLVPLFGMMFALGLPIAALIVWIVLSYRRRRRLLELHHAERMAAIERGMDLPPLPAELIDGRARRRRRTTLLPGLVWSLVGLVLTIGFVRIDDEALLVGLVPLAIGIAYLIYYYTEGKKLEAKWLEHDLNSDRPGKQ